MSIINLTPQRLPALRRDLLLLAQQAGAETNVPNYNDDIFLSVIPQGKTPGISYQPGEQMFAIIKQDGNELGKIKMYRYGDSEFWYSRVPCCFTLSAKTYSTVLMYGSEVSDEVVSYVDGISIIHAPYIKYSYKVGLNHFLQTGRYYTGPSSNTELFIFNCTDVTQTIEYVPVRIKSSYSTLLIPTANVRINQIDSGYQHPPGTYMHQEIRAPQEEQSWPGAVMALRYSNFLGKKWMLLPLNNYSANTGDIRLTIFETDENGVQFTPYPLMIDPFLWPLLPSNSVMSLRLNVGSSSGSYFKIRNDGVVPFHINMEPAVIHLDDSKKAQEIMNDVGMSVEGFGADLDNFGDIPPGGEVRGRIEKHTEGTVFLVLCVSASSGNKGAEIVIPIERVPDPG